MITAREIRDSEVVGEMDLSGYADGTAAAGGCHATLHVCIDSDGFRLPHNDNGRFRVRLSVADAAGPLAITGSTAGWPGEPFILGPWVTTDTFVWSRALTGPDQRRGRAETGRRLQGCWWAGAESNRHSRRRRFYRPLGSPPAQPTHDGGDEGTRTPGLRDANAALSQLSYIPTGVTRQTGWTGREV